MVEGALGDGWAEWDRRDAKRRGASRAVPTVTMYGSSVSAPIVFSDAAYAAMGEPPAIVLQWNAKERCVGFRPTDAADESAYRVRTHNKDRAVTGAAFRRWAGLADLPTRRYPATWEDGVLVIRLDDGEEKGDG